MLLSNHTVALRALIASLILTSSFLLSGCGGGSDDGGNSASGTNATADTLNQEDTIEENTSDADDIQSLISIQHGNPEQDSIVLLYADGGPNPNAEEDTFTLISQADDINGEKIDYDNVAFVYVKQGQMLNSAAYNIARSFTEIEKDAEQSVDILYQVANFYKQQGKTVYVQGASHGGFVVLGMLAKYGPDAADAFLIQAMRLDTPMALVNAFKKDQRAGFVYGNSNYQEGEMVVFADYWSATCKPIQNLNLTSCAEAPELNALIQNQNLDKLNAAIATPRYTTLLKRYDDLSNVGFAFTDNDEQLGGMTSEELTVLTRSGAQIYRSMTGGHSRGAMKTQVKAMREMFLLPSH
ncbi:hypothetical protein [Vibrio bivalvicida]|uniref:Peptidase S9 prolyl oligopeptidase catalytic domain-containing protein n=1 Tax=Vibrio bivalvicida TaxID=1276888 RepID=A0ABV4MDM0_9VIBR